MSTFYEVVTQTFYPYRYTILFLFLILVFGIIAYTIYSQSKSLFLNTPFNNVANSAERGYPVKICFFHVDWCPHCVKAKPEWDAFSSQFNGQVINSRLIECFDYNCTDETPEVKVLINDYNVTAYPHVVLITDGSRIDFDAKITKFSLEQFVRTVTQ